MNVVCLRYDAHIVAVDEHQCRFGDAWQPTCLDCGYVGPLVSKARARAIGAEHTAKELGVWRPAR